MEIPGVIAEASKPKREAEQKLDFIQPIFHGQEVTHVPESERRASEVKGGLESVNPPAIKVTKPGGRQTDLWSRAYNLFEFGGQDSRWRSTTVFVPLDQVVSRNQKTSLDPRQVTM